MGYEKKRILPELLAPAGSPLALDAAIEGGADAIYVGGLAFNARINAKNFTPEELKSSIARAHSYGVKVYVAANTLILDREREEYLRAAEAAYLCGADALIVADVGIGNRGVSEKRFFYSARTMGTHHTFDLNCYFHFGFLLYIV